jgi:hypothetical protein
MKTMLLTNHDVLSVLQGGALMCGLDDDGEGLLRQKGMSVDPTSLAEPRARAEGLPIVELTRDELMDLAHGKVVFFDEASEGLYVRIMTVDELMAAHERSCQAIGMEPNMTRAQAERLVAHL